MNDSAHATISEWECVQEGDRYFRYYFIGDTPAEERKQYALGWIPEGHTFSQVMDKEDGRITLYVNEQNNYFEFTYLYAMSSANYGVHYDEAIEKKNITSDGIVFEAYISLTGNEPNTIFWCSRGETVLFKISGFVDVESLIALAKSVITAGK